MNDITIYTTYNEDKPQILGMKIGNQPVQLYELFTGSGRRLSDILREVSKIRKFILAACDRGALIKVSNFKSFMTAFDLPLDHSYNFHDMHAANLILPLDEARRTVPIAVEKLHRMQTKPYQKLLADSQIVYQDLEKQGLYVNYSLVHPKWSVQTFSGRSKSMGFNIQGYYENDKIRTVYASDKDIMVYFDWVCADIRVASILSGDKNLQRSFNESDPYTYMMKIINDGIDDPDGQITRDECKKLLLKTINSMDVENTVVKDLFPDLMRWIKHCDQVIASGGHLETILGRKFKLSESKNKLAVLNGVMQGSVAHAMHNVMHSVWRKLRGRLITDIHDSLVVNSAAMTNEVKSVTSIVAPIMAQPFAGLLSDNPIFPVRVSIGREWKQWKPCPALLAQYDWRVTDT